MTAANVGPDLAAAAARRREKAIHGDVEMLIAEGLRAIVEPGSIVEVRALKVANPGSSFEATHSGYFDNSADAAREIVAQVDGRARGVYLTLNPVDPSLLARSENRLRQVRNGDPTTRDTEIVRRTRLLIDVDPVRPAGISSTDAEHEAAIARARGIRDELLQLGGPEVLLIDSGNGAQLIGALDIPADDGGLVKRVLAGLAHRFDDAAVKIDTGVFNASRIVKIPGTMTRKGDSTSDRPHRRARILEQSDELLPIGRDLLEVIASWTPKPSARKTSAPRNGESFDLEGFFSRHGIATRNPRTADGLELVDIECPVNTEHRFDAWVGRDAAGKLSAGCHHATCSLKNWHELRAIYEPERATRTRTMPAPPVREDVLPLDEPPHPAEVTAPSEEVAREYIRSDAGNAERFVDEHAGDVIHVPGLGWFVWTGTHWRKDDSESVIQRAVATMRRQTSEAMASIADDRKAAFAFALKSEGSPRIRGALELARSHPRVARTAAELDAHPMLLNVANGTLDLRTATLRPHRREDLLTHFVGIPYEPNAKAARWLRFLAEILIVTVGGKVDAHESAELISYVQRVAGLCLTGSVKEQVLFLLYGGGSNGKSVFLEILMLLVGELAKVIDIKALLFNRNDNRSAAGPSGHIARLRGARIVKAQEVEAGRRFDEATLKDLTGGDRVTARHEYKSGFDFTPQFKILIAANHRPHIHGTDRGVWRRMKCIPFVVEIPDEKQDKTLAATIIATELPGVLAWAVKGCTRWQAEGLGTCNAVEIETVKYRETEDIVGQFIEERCVIGPDEWTPTAALHADYTAWAKGSGHVDLSPYQFAERLGGRTGIEAKRTNAARGWIGIGLRSDRRLLDEPDGKVTV